MSHQDVEKCIEALCACGCEAVRASIRQLESGRPLPEAESLSEEQRQGVLRELKSIMSVYDAR